MKKIIGCIFALGVIATYLISCEKDDICAETTPTTPNMVVSFYNTDSRATYKRVTNLQYYEVGRTDTISVGTVDSTYVPLRVNAEHTQWAFIYNQPINGGIDKRVDYVDFKYTVWQEYVSRACGFKTQFLLDQDNPRGTNPVVTDGDGNGLWIQGVEIVKDSILNQNQAHVKVYF
jgi:hypothetical protein